MYMQPAFRTFINHIENGAELKLFSSIAGAGISGRVVQTLVMKNKIPLERQKKNNVFYVYFDYLDDSSCNRILKEIEELNPKVIIGMAYVLEAVANYIVKNNLKSSIHPKGVISTCQAITEKTRGIIQDYYSAPVYSRYRCEEVGLIAMEDWGGYGFRVNELEILKMNEDVPVSEGEIGRIIITDYFNYVFPFIRYDIGDLGSYKITNDGKMYLSEVVGKADELLYTSDGKLCSTTMYRSFMKKCLTVDQYQIIQHTYHDFEMILNTIDHSLEESITEEMRNIFGQDIRIIFKYVDHIPTLTSGKTRISICKIFETKKECKNVELGVTYCKYQYHSFLVA